MVRGARDRGAVAPRVWEAGELVVWIAAELRAGAAGDRVQPRGRVSRMDRGCVDSLSVVSLVRWSEATPQGLVAVVFVSLVSHKGAKGKTQRQKENFFVPWCLPLCLCVKYNPRHAEQRNSSREPSGWCAHTRKLSVRRHRNSQAAEQRGAGADAVPLRRSIPPRSHARGPFVRRAVRSR